MLLIQPIPKTGSYGGGTCSFPVLICLKKMFYVAI